MSLLPLSVLASEAPEEVRREVSGGSRDPLQRVQGLILGTFDFYSRGLQWVPP